MSAYVREYSNLAMMIFFVNKYRSVIIFTLRLFEIFDFNVNNTNIIIVRVFVEIE